MTNSTEEQDRNRQMKASFWALLFLVSEQNLAFTVLASKLGEKGILEKEDEEQMNALLKDGRHLQAAFARTESAFKERLERTLYALENPEEVSNSVTAPPTTATVERDADGT